MLPFLVQRRSRRSEGLSRPFNNVGSPRQVQPSHSLVARSSPPRSSTTRVRPRIHSCPVLLLSTAMDHTTLPVKRNHAQLGEPFDVDDVRRARRTSTYHLPPPPPPTIDKQDRRRVNPEALSSRLGPQIVAELDALIPPGAIEMPSFAARKHIQQRFNIDRRHIYDYYHAKGLRVVRDDRSGSTPSSSQQEPIVAEDVCVASRSRPSGTID
jgi:hypothetical protein